MAFGLSVLIFSIIGNGFCSINPPITKCDFTDEECVMSEIFNSALSKVVAGVPKFDIEPSDPMCIDVIIGEFPTAFYIDVNNTITGVKEWTIVNTTISSDMKQVQFTFDCPGFILKGISESEGYYFSKKISTYGPVEIYFGKFSVTVYSLFSLDSDDEGKVFGKFGKFSIKADPLGPTRYNFSLIFVEGEDKTAAVNEEVGRRWNEVTHFTTNPFMYPIVERVIYNLNKYFRLADD